MKIKEILSSLHDLVYNNAKENTKALEQTLVNSLTVYNVGMISFVSNGNNSDFDVSRAYLTMETDCDSLNDEPYVTREIVAVFVKNNHIYAIPTSNRLYEMKEVITSLEAFTHFTIQDTKLLKGLDEEAIKVIDNHYLLNINDTMFDIFQSCMEALEPVNMLIRSINISE